MDLHERDVGLDHPVSFTQLQATLDEFVRSRDCTEMMGDLSEGIEARREELVVPDPSRCYPKSADDRATLLTGTMPIRGLNAKLPEQAVSELAKLSDELNINERLCVDLWSQVNAPWQRRALEKRLSDPPGSLSGDLPLAARKLFYLERHNLLLFECELLKAALVSDMSKAKKAVIDREIFCLLEKGLAPNLMSFVAELLGPEGLRRAQPASSSSASGPQVPGAFGAAAPAPAASSGAAPDSGGLSDGAAARREEFLLNSLVRAVETLFFIYYSYQIKPAEANQLVNLIESAGRELLRLQKAVADNTAFSYLGRGGSQGTGTNRLRSSFAGGGHFDGSQVSRGFGAGAAVGGGAAAAAERQRDVARLCAVMEVTAVLLCTLSGALSQENTLHGRAAAGQINGKGNALAAIAAGNGAGGGAVGGAGVGVGVGLGGRTEDIADLNKLICDRKWDHEQVQAAVLVVWGSFVAPFAVSQQAFAGVVDNSVQHLHNIMGAAASRGAVRFLRGEVLTTLRRPPFPGLDLTPRAFYLEALSGVAVAYVNIALAGGDGSLMPHTREQRVEEIDAWRYHGGAFSQEQLQEQYDAVRAEDTMEDVMYWVGQLAEAYPNIAAKLWEEPANLPRYLQKVAIDNRDMMTPWLVFLGGLALETPDDVYDLMDVDGSECGWEFFVRNLEEMPRQLNPPPLSHQPGDGGYVVPPPRSKLSDRVRVLFEALCGLLQRIMLSERIRPHLANHDDYRVLRALTNLVRCGVRPSLKGAIFKALAACAKDPTIAVHLWTFIEDAQLVPTRITSVHGQHQLNGGGLGGSSSSSNGGLFVELEQVESRDGTYPATEGFCCLMQELVLHDIPFNLGDKRRYSGVGGIQAYVSYLEECVLMPELRFSDPGERWRIVARVLQVMVTLLRRYPLTKAGEAGPGGSGNLSTGHDEEQCTLDFATGTSAQGRCKSPGYYILRQILGQGGLFRQLVQVLRAGGGVTGLTASRAESATETVVAEVLLKKANQAPGSGAGAIGADRFGTSSPPAGSSSLDTSGGPVRPGGPGPDWSWWRERSVILALSLLDAAAGMEEAFIVKWRERVAAGGLDDDDDAATGGYVGGGAGGFGGGGTGVGAVGGGAGLGRRGGGGGGRGSLAPPANLGKLLAEGNTIAAVARYIEYEGNMVIPLLSTSLLLSCSRNLPPGTMLETLLASDPLECNALAEAYTACLAAEGLGPGARLPSLEAMLSPPEGEADSDLMAIKAALVGAGAVTRSGGGESERDFEGEAGALRTVRMCILDLLLENVEQRGPNLSHLLLGLTPSGTAHSAWGGGSDADVNGGRGGRGPAPSACLEAVVGLLKNPLTLQQEPRLAEKCAHLVYKLCASEATRVPVLDRLRNSAGGSQSNEAFFPHALRIALAAEQGRLSPAKHPESDESFQNHFMAWLLKCAAMDVRTSCEGKTMHFSHARALLKALFVGDAPGSGGGKALGGSSHFGIFQGSFAGLGQDSHHHDQARAPLLTLLENKIELGREGPARNPGDARVRGLLIQAAIPLPPPGGSEDAGGREFRIIDVAHLQELLRAEVAAQGLGEVPLSGEAKERERMVLAWAADWNKHTVRLASQAHLCQAWRQVLELSFVSAGALLFGPPRDPTKGVAPRRLLSALLLGVLRKLMGRGGAEERLLQPLGRACLSVAGVLRELGSCAPLQLAESKQLIFSLLGCLAGTKGVLAASNASTAGEGSKAYRACLYGCLVHLLEHTQGRGDVMHDGTSGQGDGGDGLRAASAGALSSPTLSHEALRGEHRLQNVELLRAQIEPLAHLLNEDARYGPNISQCLALTLLSSILATLTLDLDLDPTRHTAQRGDNGAAGGVVSGARVRGGVFAEDVHMKEIQGSQTRVALLQFLQSKGFFLDLTKLLKGVRPGSGVAVPGIVLEAVLGLFTQVACSAEGAMCLLEVGVVIGVAESERMKTASEIAMRASKLGALGSETAMGGDKGSGEFQAEGPSSLRVLLIPGLLVLQAMLASLPNNVTLADQAADFLCRHAQLVRHVLLFKENSLDTLKAMSAILAIVAHVSKPPYQGLLERKVGGEVVRGWRDLAERALVAFGGNPLPQGSGEGVGWWSSVQPTTKLEEALANELCQGPPGGPASQWTAFDSAKLEASQRALAHAVDVLRFRAADAAASHKTSTSSTNGINITAASSSSWLAVSPEGLCVALRACVDNARAGTSNSGSNDTTSGRGGGAVGTTGNGIGVMMQSGGGAGGDGRAVRAVLLPYVVEGLLAALLYLVDTHSEEGRRQLAAYRKGLVPTLTELLQDVSNEAFVLRSARTLIGRLSGHDATNDVPSVFGSTGGYDGSNIMNVA